MRANMEPSRGSEKEVLAMTTLLLCCCAIMRPSCSCAIGKFMVLLRCEPGSEKMMSSTCLGLLPKLYLECLRRVGHGLVNRMIAAVLRLDAEVVGEVSRAACSREALHCGKWPTPVRGLTGTLCYSSKGIAVQRWMSKR